MDRFKRLTPAVTAMLALLVGPASAAPTAEGSIDRSEQLRSELHQFFSGPTTLLGGTTGEPAARRAILDGLAALAPEELAAMAEGFSAVPAWQAVPETLSAALPAASRDALRRYADETAQDAQGLLSFRDDLATVYAAARLLPAETRARLGAASETLVQHHAALTSMDLGHLKTMRGALAPSGDLHALSGRLSDALPATVRRHLPALAAHGAFDAADLRDLASFRSEIDSAIELTSALPPGLRNRFAHPLAGVRAKLSRATPEQLFILREELDPAALRSAVGTVAVLAGLPPSEAQAVQLEAWRAATVRFYRDLAGADARAEASARAVEGAAPRRLLLMQAALSTPPSDPNALLALPIAIGRLSDDAINEALINLNCVIDLGSISTPFGDLDLGEINLNWICTPFENAINALQSAMSTVSNAVSDVIDTVASLPGDLAETLKNFFANLAADALALFSPENLQGALGLFGDFWEQLPPIPTEIPCPDLGTEIAQFGAVGSEGTAASYRRALWVFDKVIEMIPETETSLVLKIPAQVLYGGVQYLGVCLDQAEEQRKQSAASAQHDDVMAGLDGASSGLTQLAGQLGALGGDMAARFDGMAALANGLAIEAALAELGSAGNRPRVASFQLPASVGGAIELVRDIVADVIDKTRATGEDVHCAPEELERGDDAYAAGRYKVAFDFFRRAYQEAARNSGPAGCAQAVGSPEPR
jgi:hypothetical protein